MKKKRALSASRMPDDYLTSQSGPIYTVQDPAQTPNAIILYVGNDHEMIKITRTSFYVRGVEVKQDDKEAEIVYNAFREWMTYSALVRKY